jgi:N-acetylglucosaminyldiphosphoundecaprenol N-acetyl-beta-D-mannosaminyltransferase
MQLWAAVEGGRRHRGHQVGVIESCFMLQETRHAGTREEPGDHADAGLGLGPTWVWGLPLSPLTAAEAIEAIARRVEAREPSFFITANLNYAMLTARDESLRQLNERAFLMLADGMPLVWASHWAPTLRPLPERVPGSDLIYALSALAASRGYRLFLLGGGPGVAQAAARNLTARDPGLQVVGTESPPFRALSAAENDALVARIQAARPDLLLVAFGQPKGELWLTEHLDSLGVPVAVQVGASLDFAAGLIRRAPRWLQKTGLEWAFRLYLEPRRLCRRYFDNALFLLHCVAHDLARGCAKRPPWPRVHPPSSTSRRDRSPRRPEDSMLIIRRPTDTPHGE